MKISSNIRWASYARIGWILAALCLAGAGLVWAQEPPKQKITPAADAPQSMPPKAPIRSVTDDYFGTNVVDNYRYFENLKDPEVQQWIKAQADYTRATLDALPGYSALLKRVEDLDESEPAQVSDLQIVAGRYYTLRRPPGGQSPRLYVRDGVKGEDHLLIDPEKLSTDQNSHLTIEGYAPSPDGRYVAYGLAAGGSEQSTLHILDVQAGKDLPETADRVQDDPVWRADSRSFFYPRAQKLTADKPPAERWNNPRVYVHVLGRAFDDDPPIVGRGVSDPAISLAPTEIPRVMTVPGSRYAIAFVFAGADTRLRVYAAPIDSVRDGHTAWRPVAASYDDQYIGSDTAEIASIALTGDTLYWISRKDAPRGRILKLDLARRDSKPEIVVPQGELPISEVYATRDAIYWRASDAGVNGVRRLRLQHGARIESLHLPYAANVVDVSTDAESSATVLSATSSLRSPAYLGVDAKTGAIIDTELQPAARDDHPDDLVDEEVKVKSWDGTEVPLSITRMKTVKLDGDNPTVILGYGAYGVNASPPYSRAMRAWYERNGVTATCHVRGGGEYGEAWHQAGFQATKPNTWKDLIACGEYLIAHRYTSASRLSAVGGSAGGIMIGRAIEERPDLFAAVVARSPDGDMLRFETTAAGPHNVREFGTVKTESGFKALYAMSPYANVKDGVRYPAVLITIGINDQRVPAWISAKFAARLQAATASGKPVLLRADYDTGHGLIDMTRRQRELALVDDLAFWLWQTGDPAFQLKH
jgi:prolyl oligopeptidase